MKFEVHFNNKGRVLRIRWERERWLLLLERKREGRRDRKEEGEIEGSERERSVLVNSS
jgi:hypothetical protein